MFCNAFFVDLLTMIKKWHIKALVQKTISFFPYKEKVNYFFQKHITKGAILNDVYFQMKIQHAKDHIEYHKQYHSNTNKENTTILELGTGWYPIIPISFYLCEIGHTTTIDAQNWLNLDRLKTTIAYFLEWHKTGKLQQALPHLKKEKLDKLEHLLSKNIDFKSLLKTLQFDYKIGDINKMNLQENYFDFICSNNTFEHIYFKDLKNILYLFKKVIKKDGVMSHFIDMTDHFAHFDHSITIYNFLKYSKTHWQWIDNTIQAQNRMRFSDYINLYNQLNIKIIHQVVEKGKIEDLQKVKIHQSFQNYNAKDLAISHCYLISAN